MNGSATAIARDDHTLDDQAADPRVWCHRNEPQHDVETPGNVRFETSGDAFARHLGARLAAKRRCDGQPLWVIASRSRGDVTLHDLRDVEAGAYPLDPVRVQRLAELYGVEVRAILPSTQRGLEIGDGTITAGGVTVEFAADDTRSMVEAYFRLIHLARSASGTTGTAVRGEILRPVAVRHDDLGAMVAQVTRPELDGRASDARHAEALQRVFAMAAVDGRVVVASLLSDGGVLLAS